MTKKALLVVDIQNICLGNNHNSYFKYEPNFVDKINSIIKQNSDSTVIYIRNVMKKSLINRFAPFHAYFGSDEVELVSSLLKVGNNVYDKYEGNAFSNKKLLSFIKDKEIDTVEIIGVDGAGCVALTALGAIKCGYKVILNTNGIGTMSIKRQEKYFNKIKGKGGYVI